MSKSITIEELNKRIDKIIADHEKERSSLLNGDYDESELVEVNSKIEALNDLKIDLNDPEAIEDITENVQQTLNVIETKKIIGDEL